MDHSECLALYTDWVLDVYPHNLKISVSEGKGSRVKDLNGRWYLDFSSGLGALSLGHCHRGLTDILSAQLNRSVHFSNLFYMPEQALLCKKLCSLTGLKKAYLCNSGSEAFDTAIKIARRWGNNRGRNKIVHFTSGWHGRSVAAISASSDRNMREGFEPLLPGFLGVSPFDLDAIERELKSGTVCAVLIEPILGHGGVRVPPPDFLPSLRKICNTFDVLFIADEIQCGCGRAGAFSFAQAAGAKPDILLFGKGLGGGLPIGAMLCTDECAEVMEVGSHGATFGGNPLSSAAANYVVDTLSKTSFLERVRELGSAFLRELFRIKESCKWHVREIRGIGLMVAVDFGSGAKAFQRKLADNGLICTTLGDEVLRFLPPLNLSDEDLEEAVDIVEETCINQ